MVSLSEKRGLRIDALKAWAEASEISPARVGAFDKILREAIRRYRVCPETARNYAEIALSELVEGD